MLMNMSRKSLACFSAVVVTAMLSAAAVVPSVAADEAEYPVTSSRSFAGRQSRNADLLQEATSIDVKSDADYGGIESLNVPKTESKAEKEARVRAEAEKKAEQEAEKAAAEAVSRAAERSTASTESSADASTAVSTPASADASALLSYASTFMGPHPYVVGGVDPNTGWDCSGFVQVVFAKAGIAVPHSSHQLTTFGTTVSEAEARPGDIVARPGHAAIYMGNGKIIHMTFTEVTISDLTPGWMGGGGYTFHRVM